MPTNDQQPQKFNWLWPVALVLAVWIYRSGGTNPNPTPNPPKPADITAIVRQSLAEQRSGFASVFREASAKVKDGSITKDIELANFTGPKMKAVRERAFASIDDEIQRNLPRDEDKLRPEAAAYFEAVAKAFEAAK